MAHDEHDTNGTAPTGFATTGAAIAGPDTFGSGEMVGSQEIVVGSAGSAAGAAYSMTPSSQGCEPCELEPGQNDHPTFHLVIGDFAACVDEGMIPLVAECWFAGIATKFSCQDSDDAGQLMFLGPDDYDSFIQLCHAAFATSLPHLFNRVLNQDKTLERDRSPRLIIGTRKGEYWKQYLMHSRNVLGYSWGDDIHPTSVNVELPYEDILTVADALAAHRGGRAVPTPTHALAGQLELALSGHVRPLRISVTHAMYVVVDLPDAAALDQVVRLLDPVVVLYTTTHAYPTGTARYVGTWHGLAPIAVRGGDGSHVRNIADPVERAWRLVLSDRDLVPAIEALLAAPATGANP